MGESPKIQVGDEDTASMAIVAAETDYGEVVGEADGSGDTL
jgi:hypothetical protein